MPFNQKEYIESYNKKTYKMFPFRVRRDDVDVINKLTSVPNLNKYIYSLIDNDINPNVLSIKQIKERIKPVIEKHGIKEVYLFGSYARGEANRDSDVDIYCDTGDIKTLIDQGFFEEDLVSALGKEVDVIFIGSTMDAYFKEQLEEDKIKILFCWVYFLIRTLDYCKLFSR